MFDGHIHIRPGKPDPENLMASMSEAGIEGGILISMPPDNEEIPARLENLQEWTSGHENLVPFFWVDINDGSSQVQNAKEHGAEGLKIICDSFYPGDDRCLEICRAAAGLDMPVLFHSGILWDGKSSSEYCRPVHFESLFEVDDLRFALAHIGWPWIDEMIAVYGKFQNFRTMNPDSHIELFIDTTPGTPAIYREEAFRRLLTVGYDIKKNIFFGSDCDANSYNVKWVSDWTDIDRSLIYRFSDRESLFEDIFRNNAKRFIEKDHDVRKFSGLMPAL